MTRHQMLMSLLLKTARLPAEFQEVEWIGSSGTQYIDTTALFSKNERIVAKISLQTLSQATMFGLTNNANHLNRVITYNDKLCLQTSYNGTSIIFELYSPNIDEILNMDIISNDRCIVNNQTTITHLGVDETRSCYIFALLSSTNTVISFATMKLYSFEMYDSGGTLVRNFVPCYRKLDNVIGLYDLVNGVFYTNAGTGDFTKGSDII